MTATNCFTFEQALQTKAAIQPKAATKSKATSGLQTVFTAATASSVAAVLYLTVTSLIF